MTARDQKPKEELPLRRYTLLRTTDREVALAAAEDAIAPMSVAFSSSQGELKYHLCAAEFSRTRLLAHEQVIDGGARFAVEPSETNYIVEIPISGRSRVRHGEEFDVGTERSGAIMSPNGFTSWIDDGLPYQALSVHFNTDLVRSRFSLLTGIDAMPDIAFDPRLDLQSSAGRSFFSLLRDACKYLDEDSSIFRNEHSASLYEEILINVFLTEFQHSHSSILEGKIFLAANLTVKKAEEYLEQHADRPVAIADVANAVGVSVRSLQRTFQKLRGTTPMRWLKQLRLARARRRLLSAGPSANISQIAGMSGFVHLSHFASEYKCCFGESPSETVKRLR
jgi:AraC-like DNA-binding protein